MPGVLGPDDLGWLTLVLSTFKYLNLNPIMTGVLGPDDLGRLTLVLSSFKCLNLNSIITGVLGLDDLGWLALTLSFFRYSNLNLSVLLKIPIWVNYTYCHPVTFKDTYSTYALQLKS